MTYEYEYAGGPNDKKRFVSEAKVTTIRVDGGEYSPGISAHVQDYAESEPHIDKNVVVLDWAPESS